MDRRSFLRSATLVGGALALGGASPQAFASASRAIAERASKGFVAPSGTILDLPAASSPIDTVVVVMMENRSFDHYLGWLATDEHYLDEGRRRYGSSPDPFFVDGEQRQTYKDPEGRAVDTYYLPAEEDEPNPYRRCGDHPDPGHGWSQGRAQRDRGFLGEGSGNDDFALGYYLANDLELYASLARRFTIFDRYHCSLLGPTYPNREYLHSGQSGGHKSNDTQGPNPDGTVGFQWPTIWDRLSAAGVPAGYYHIDLPVTALWGHRLLPFTHHIEEYFARCASGTLPNVVFLDPGFTTDFRTDDHPAAADLRSAQRLLFDYLKAFVESPHWQRGAFLITYDEWGGVFDHVRPPLLPDDRASDNDADDFRQAGFRVPTLLASPYAQPGFVDHNLYDHTSVLRFLQWRFLGAPAAGSGGSDWWLSTRNRFAHNIGASLVTDARPGFSVAELPKVPVASPPCGGPHVPAPHPHPFEQTAATGYFEMAGYPLGAGLPRL